MTAPTSETTREEEKDREGRRWEVFRAVRERRRMWLKGVVRVRNDQGISNMVNMLV